MSDFSLAACRHIVVEGAIGVGKSSLSRKLAAHLGARLMLEKPEENPFLEHFYADGSRYAFQTQMFFLFQRVEQYRELCQFEMFSEVVVSDFLFAKDAIFARLTLNDDEYQLYGLMYRHLAPQIPEPDLVIWLQAELPTLMERIQKRGLPMEQGIDAGYLQRICDSYFEYFRAYDGAPVLVVDTESFNPIEDEQDFALLLQRIDAMKGRRERFAPRSRATG
jgi:deoxyadenosine/deoxycytidine kinase